MITGNGLIELVLRRKGLGRKLDSFKTLEVIGIAVLTTDKSVSRSCHAAIVLVVAILVAWAKARAHIFVYQKLVVDLGAEWLVEVWLHF